MNAPLLPPSPALRLDALTINGGIILLKATTVARSVPCPECGCATCHRHSRYQRTLLDLPWQGQSLHIELSCRKFFCDNLHCVRRIFTERLPKIATPYARKTQRLADALRELAFLVGGEAAAKIARTFGLLLSPDSLLANIKKASPPPFPTPRVLGIDDFAFRKGRTYGTILVDLERRCPVDLLPDREAKSVATWLAAHPGVEVVSRDRAEFYRNGITAGAPDAIQVADRFHLLANLRQALQESLIPYKKHFLRPAMSDNCARGSPQNAGLTTRQQKLQAQRRHKRYDTLTKIQALRNKGHTQAQIALEVGVSLRTVARFSKADSYPERQSRTRSPNSLTPSLPYLRQQWEAGRRCAASLHRQIQEQGFTGSYGSVYGALCRLNKGMALFAREASVAIVPARPGHYSVRQMTWLFLRSATEGSPSKEEAADLLNVLRLVPSLTTLRDLTQEFVRLIRSRDVSALESWLCAASVSLFGAMKRLALGLAGDAAVRSALEQEWSNGQVEGQVNRLKLVKRSMYGRGSFPLLRARVLHQAAS